MQSIAATHQRPIPHASAALLKPASEVIDGPYELKSLSAPVLRGWLLDVCVYLFANATGWLFYPRLAQQGGVSAVLHGMRIPEQPLFLPDTPRSGKPETGCTAANAPSASDAVETFCKPAFCPPSYAAAMTALPASSDAGAVSGSSVLPTTGGTGHQGLTVGSSATVSDFHLAYKTGASTPSLAMENIISFLSASELATPHPCHWLTAWDKTDIRRQAEECSQRWASGTQRGILDGIPFVVKDVADALPYPTTAGTSFIANGRPVLADAPYVSALKQMGAILLGKSSLHEIGLGVTGLNLVTGTALNPHNPAHFCGGSSSGSGALIAAGVCPLAIGSDGGGSIRIPASFCGIVGLKPTNGRVSCAGVVEIDCSVATMGPMAGCVADVALLHLVMSNHGTLSSTSHPAVTLPSPWPHPSLSAGDTKALEGCRMGVYWQWFEDAAPDVVARCRSAVTVLQEQGADLSPVVIPELEHLRVAHNVTIASEMLHHFKDVYNNPSSRGWFNKDVRLALSIVRFWTPADYVTAQCIRARATTHFNRVFETCDVIITPSTPLTAPPAHPTALQSGESDLRLTSKIMRYAVHANMLGLPAISLPVGVDSKGLPVGLQITGRAWQEGTLIRMAAVLEAALTPSAAASVSSLKSVVPQPMLHINPLTGARSGL
ncbi:MAG: hypothetical protein WDW38_007696 [Sanguina aurantia]